MEAQPILAVNPTDPDNIAVAWMEDWADSHVVGVTYDGGRTWTKVVPPGTSHCSGAPAYNSAINPHLSFAADGKTLYLSTYNFDSENPVFRVIVNVSRDGGLTWTEPYVLDETGFPERFLDWSWVVADPNDPDLAYASWMSSDASFTRLVMLLSRTEDGGETWSAPREIGFTPAGHWHGPPRIVVLPDGSLVNVFHQLPACHPFTGVPRCERGDMTLMSSYSTDRGESWSTPAAIGVIRPNHTDEDMAKLGVLQAALPAVGPDGSVYYAWTEIAEEGSSVAYLLRSVDGGRTWLPRAPVISSEFAMMNPNVSVAATGTLGLLFYDDRRDIAGDDEFTVDVWLATSSDGGSSWRETHLGGPFDARSVPDGDDIGEYQGIAPVGEDIATAFTMGDPPSTVGATDIFFARVRTK